ncbi:MAG: ATP-binding protein [Planctomyces sp.]|nr:ATP-binding protein [Planctomyces sp.]
MSVRSLRIGCETDRGIIQINRIEVNMENAWFYAGGAAFLGVVASCWHQLQAILIQISSRMVVSISVCGFQSDAVQLLLRERFKASRFGPRTYIGWLLHVPSRQRTQLIAMETVSSGGRIFWDGWKPIWVTRDHQSDANIEEGVTSRDWNSQGLRLLFLRGTFDPDALVFEAAEHFNLRMVSFAGDDIPGRRRHSVRHIYGTAGLPAVQLKQRKSSDTSPASAYDTRACRQNRPIGWSESELGYASSEGQQAIDRLALNDATRQMVREAHFWKDNEDWYRERSIPWRRGWLLHGPPGTGKTALMRAIAEDLDLPVFVYDLASLTNEELQTEWSQMLTQVPCMAVMEDMDAVFNGRQNVTGREQHLTFDCLLNCMDGIERCDGLFMVITTNRLEEIDPALGIPEDTGQSSRPGRIDRTLFLGPLSESGRLQIAQRILIDAPDYHQQIVRQGDGDTAAQFQERCTRLALDLLWRQQKPSQDLTPEVEDTKTRVFR